MSNIDLGNSPIGSPPTEPQKAQIRSALDLNINAFRPITRNISGAQNLNFNTNSIKEFLENLFFPSVNPSVITTISSTTQELGFTPSITFSSTINTNDFNVSSFRITRGGTLLEELLNLNKNVTNSLTNTDTYSSTVSFASSAITNTGITINGTSRTCSFIDPIYSGMLSLSEIQNIVTNGANRSTLSSLLTRQLVGKSSRSFSFSGTSKRMVYIYPNSYGNINTILDPNSFNITTSFLSDSFSYERNDNSTVAFRLLYNNMDVNLTDFQVTFNF